MLQFFSMLDLALINALQHLVVVLIGGCNRKEEGGVGSLHSREMVSTIVLGHILTSSKQSVFRSETPFASGGALVSELGMLEAIVISALGCANPILCVECVECSETTGGIGWKEPDQRTFLLPLLFLPGASTGGRFQR